MDVSLGIVHYRGPTRVRLERDLWPTLRFYPDWNFELVCIDNDPAPAADVLATLQGSPWPVTYLWNGGRNRQIAASKNQLFQNAACPYLVYVCANHGRMYDPTWLEDLLAPLVADEAVAMTGCVGRFRLSSIDAGQGRGEYVQGGILAGRVETLRRHPYSDQYPHGHSDTWVCWNLTRHGYKLAHVPTVLSLWRKPLPDTPQHKYVHAEE